MLSEERIGTIVTIAAIIAIIVLGVYEGVIKISLPSNFPKIVVRIVVIYIVTSAIGYWLKRGYHYLFKK